jgi:hypothetical protein
MRTYAALALVAALHIATPAQAQEVTLRAVTAFAEKTTYSRGFETFVERVNEAGKGVIRINYIGGPKAMPPFEVGNALKNGVIEIANVTGAFYTNLLPEADAWKLTQRCEAITFDTAGSKHYLDVAYEAGWAGVIRQTPEHGPKLQASAATSEQAENIARMICYHFATQFVGTRQNGKGRERREIEIMLIYQHRWG